MNIRLKYATLIIFSALWSLGASAGGHQKGGRSGPPQAAIDACAAQAVGDACSFANPKGVQKEGTCTEARDEVITCRAKGHKGKGGKKKGKNKQANDSDSDSDSDSDDNAAE